MKKTRKFINSYSFIKMKNPGMTEKTVGNIRILAEFWGNVFRLFVFRKENNVWKEIHYNLIGTGYSDLNRFLDSFNFSEWIHYKVPSKSPYDY